MPKGMKTKTNGGQSLHIHPIRWQDYDPVLKQAAGLLIASFILIVSIDDEHESKI